MKKPLLLLALNALGLHGAQAQTPVRSLLADFGPNDAPNGNITPSPGLVSIAGPAAREGTPVAVFDVLGRAVLATRLRGGQLDLRAVAPGVYSLVLDTPDGLVHKRLVRQQE